MRRPKLMLTAGALLCAAAGYAAPAAKPDITYKDAGKGYSFEYSYPDIVMDYPKLKKNFDSERLEELSSLRADAKAMLSDLKPGDEAPTSVRETNWKQVTNLPNYLSLSNDEYEYNGGAAH
jgi:Deacetylase PdaC